MNRRYIVALALTGLLATGIALTVVGLVLSLMPATIIGVFLIGSGAVGTLFSRMP